MKFEEAMELILRKHWLRRSSWNADKFIAHLDSTGEWWQELREEADIWRFDLEDECRDSGMACTAFPCFPDAEDWDATDWETTYRPNNLDPAPYGLIWEMGEERPWRLVHKIRPKE